MSFTNRTLTTGACIEVGDVLFCVNGCEYESSSHADIYITPTRKEASMFDEIEKVIGSNESCTMRLIHKKDIL